MSFLANAVVYDIELYPNCFTLTMECLNSDVSATWEISQYRDDRVALLQWFQWLAQTQTPMIGFNNIAYDYVIIHFLFHNPQATIEQLYAKNQEIFAQQKDERFGSTIWPRNRFAPQVDLLKVHHFDNKAKSTSLKALEINMRSPFVVDLPFEPGTYLSKEQIDHVLVPYNAYDVKQTKAFAFHSMEALNFRISQIETFGIDVMNWADTKIGSQIMESRLGDELCYEGNPDGYGKGRKRQTVRTRIALNDIIFPYIQFEHPEFRRVVDYLRTKVLTIEEIDAFNQEATLKTKGVFTDLYATIDGFRFDFGTGGIHGSVTSKRIQSGNGWLIRDIDVAALYPSIAIVNRLAPAHLGERFTQEYANLPLERKRWQKEKGKKCVEANTLKLASNGVYGNSNNKFSVFYDSQYTLTVTINGQLMLCMLAERLLKIPTLKIIQINTDGITYFIHESMEPIAKKECQAWEQLTALVLEDANYKRMWIRDVNSYIAEDMDGNLKLKGAYWYPDPLNYHKSISESQPPAWHKDLGNSVSIQAAVAAMVHGVPPETFIRMNRNPYDFMCRIKVKRSDVLLHGGERIQKTCRYYVARDGKHLVKQAPPTGTPGAFKKKNGVSDYEYQRIMQEVGGQWDGRIHTANRSKYETRETAIEAGHVVALCNDASHFVFDNVKYEWYIEEAKKLIIG